MHICLFSQHKLHRPGHPMPRLEHAGEVVIELVSHVMRLDADLDMRVLPIDASVQQPHRAVVLYRAL